MTDATFPAVLATAFEFTENDLHANRQGHLSDDQIRWLRTNAQAYQAGMFPCGVIAAVLALTAAALATMSGWLQLLALVVAGLALMAVALLGYTVWYGRHFRRDIREQRVRSIEGQMHKDVTTHRRSASIIYTIEVDGSRHVVNKEQFTAVREGRPYRLYVTPLAGMLLTLEPLDAT